MKKIASLKKLKEYNGKLVYLPKHNVMCQVYVSDNGTYLLSDCKDLDGTQPSMFYTQKKWKYSWSISSQRYFENTTSNMVGDILPECLIGEM